MLLYKKLLLMTFGTTYVFRAITQKAEDSADWLFWSFTYVQNEV